MSKKHCPCCNACKSGTTNTGHTQYMCGTSRGAKDSDHLIHRSMTCLFYEAANKKDILLADNLRLRKIIQTLERTITELTDPTK